MTEYTPEELEKMRDEAIMERLRRETVRVVIKPTGLRFTIDRELVEQWKRELTRDGQPFTLTDTTTELLMYDSETAEEL